MTHPFGDNFPNLDDYSDDPDDHYQVSEVFWLLSNYERLKMMSIKARRLGNIDLAQRCERDQESIYKNLPDWAKW